MSKRKAIKILPSVEYLRACFDYDQQTGVAIWKERPQDHFRSAGDCAAFNGRWAGTQVGTLEANGYRQVHIDRVHYLLHRVIWKLETGEEPQATIDHDDGDRSNNRWKNLRPATMTEQSWNKDVPTRKALSGHRGVVPNGNKWVVKMNAHGVYRYLGTFETLEAAAAAYEAAARDLHGEFYLPKGERK